MPHDPYQALYLHIPFCVRRCAYCDFTTRAAPRESPEIDEYVENLCLELRRMAREGELTDVKSVYLGGGTPTHIGANRLTMLLYTLSTAMNLSPDVEVTIEANPESLHPALVRDLWALGVNRISIGVQSFDDEVLKRLGRAHDADDARQAIEMAAERFTNISVDVMAAAPGQTPESLMASLEEAVGLGVAHVSLYPLAIEPHTLFDSMLLAGQIQPMDEDAQAEELEAAQRLLEEAGLHRYEVANFAKDGFACVHNMAYWTTKPYLGLGLSAVTMTQNAERRMRVQDGRVIEDLDPAQMAAEDLMLRMRLAEGVREVDLQERAPLLPGLAQAVDEVVQLGLAEWQDGRLRPTDRGWLLGNELFARFYDLAP